MPAANDAFASATVLAGMSGTAPVDNTGAGYEVGEPANDLGADGGVSVWYKIVLGSNDGFGWYLHASTGSSPDTLWDSTIEFFTGASLGALTLLDSGDDIDYAGGNFRSALDYDYATIADGETVWIRVDGWNDWGGGVSATTATGILTWSAEAAPPPASGSLVLFNIRQPGPGSIITKAVIGSTVVVYGNDLTDVFRIYFGSTPVTSFTLDDSQHISVVVPADATPDPGGAVTILDHTGLSGSTAFKPQYPGPWITPAPIYGPERVPAGSWVRSNRTWTEASAATFLTGPDASSDGTTGTGTAQHFLDTAGTPKFMAQGSAIVDAQPIWDSPSELAAVMPPFEPPVESDPPGSDGFEYQNPAATTGTFDDAYQFDVVGNIGSNPSGIILELRRIPSGSYTIRDVGDPGIAPDWFLPSELAALDLITSFTDTVAGQRSEVVVDFAPGDLDDDTRFAFVVAFVDYTTGSAVTDGNVGVFWVPISFRYVAETYRWLYDAPQVGAAGLRSRQRMSRTGGAPRSRQIRSAAGSLRRGPGATP